MFQPQDDLADFTEPEQMETCAACDAKFWRQESDADNRDKFCSSECEVEDREAE